MFSEIVNICNLFPLDKMGGNIKKSEILKFLKC